MSAAPRRPAREGRKSFLGELLYRLYPRSTNSGQRLIRKIAYLTEGRHFYSITLRRIFKDYHGVEIGMYSYGACFEVYGMDRGTVIGRYCSIASGVRGLTHNHPLDRPSTHGFFFNPELGYLGSAEDAHGTLRIGNDVWIGHNAIILPSVHEICDGAVVGAGAVLTKDVPPYAIMVGNPARLLRYRFPEETVKALRESKWWEKRIEELDIGYFTRPLDAGPEA